MTTSVVVFDATVFRYQIPEYADPTKYPDVLIESFWDTAVFMSTDEDYGMVAGLSRQFALNLLAAHLIAINNNIASSNGGSQGGFVKGSTIDKISVEKLAPPASDMSEWWFAQTPRGQQLLVMLEIASVGGIGVGGLPESSAFRKVGGIF